MGRNSGYYAAADLLTEVCGREPSLAPLAWRGWRGRGGHEESAGGRLARPFPREVLARHLGDAFACDEPRVGTVCEVRPPSVRADSPGHAFVTVENGDDAGRTFPIWLPFDCFPGSPELGERYDVVFWSLWGRWQGADAYPA
jgi:hypothetical protein